jgi:hypothetical protein
MNVRSQIGRGLSPCCLAYRQLAPYGTAVHCDEHVRIHFSLSRSVLRHGAGLRVVDGHARNGAQNENGRAGPPCPLGHIPTMSMVALVFSRELRPMSVKKPQSFSPVERVQVRLVCGLKTSFKCRYEWPRLS